MLILTLHFSKNTEYIYLIVSVVINRLTGITNLDFNSANSEETVC